MILDRDLPDERSEREEEEVQSATAADSGSFRIIGGQELDSFQSEAWKSYLQSEALLSAYEPPPGSPYFQYMKTKTIRSVDGVGKKIQPRYSGAEQKSEREIGNLILHGGLGSETAIILDSGGPHSVAMAIKLAEHGYQPVITFNSIPHSNGILASEQELATLLYFAERMKKLKQEKKVQANSPPAFVVDGHRVNSLLYAKANRYDNNYQIQVSDFPTAEELKAQGIKRVIYLNEGDQQGFIRPDYQSIKRVYSTPELQSLFGSYSRNGIQVEYTGIAPCEHRDEFSS